MVIQEKIKKKDLLLTYTACIPCKLENRFIVSVSLDFLTEKSLLVVFKLEKIEQNLKNGRVEMYFVKCHNVYK